MVRAASCGKGVPHDDQDIWMEGPGGGSVAAAELGLELRRLEGGASRTIRVLNKLEELNDRYPANSSDEKYKSGLC